MEVAAVVGFASSLGQLIEITSHVIHVLNDIKTGGNDRRKLLLEVDNLRSILQQLSSGTANAGSKREAWLDIVQSLHDEGGVFDQIRDVMSEIRSRIDRRQGLRLLTQTLFWPFVKEDVERNMKQLHRLYQAVALKLQQAQLSLSLNTDQTVSRISRTADKRELRSVLEWLSPLNFLEQQELEYGRHSIGTCKWFVQSKKFQDWILRDQQVLFCTAIGGAGKTVLTSVAVDHIRMKTAGQNIGVLVIYCKHDKPETHSVEKLALALLKQLIQMRTFVPPNLEAILQEHYYNNDTRPKHDDVVNVINTELQRFSHYFIFVDGLDEITDDKARGKVIDFIMSFHGTPSVWFTSRPIQVIEEVFVTSGPWLLLPLPLRRVQVRPDHEESGSEDEQSDAATPHLSNGDDECFEGDTLCEQARSSLSETLDLGASTASTSSNDVSQGSDKLADDQRCSMCQNKLKTIRRHCKHCQSPGFVACENCYQKGGHCSYIEHEHFLRYLCTRMDVSAKPRAIRTFVRRRILESPELTKWVRKNGSFAAEIESEVTRAAHKMFLLAQLHMDAISDPDLLKFSEVRKALETLPNKLNESYDKAMDRVRGHGVSLLRLLCFAERPLSGAEVEHALGITPGSRILSEDEIIPANVLISRCAGLVVINGEGALTFSHYTIAGYFGQRRQDLFGNGHALLAQSCLTYLQLSAFKEGPVTEPDEAEAYEARLHAFPFLDYASLFWAHHTMSSNDKELEHQAYRFLTDDRHRNASVQALWFSSDLKARSWRNRHVASPLRLAVFFKHHAFVVRLLQQGTDDMSNVEDELSPLIWAVHAGDATIVDLVLNGGADINSRDLQGNTALHIAIPHDHSEVCKLLITKPELNVNTVQARGQKSALMLAAQYGRTSVVEQLLGRGDLLLNLRDSDGSTALHLGCGSTGVVKLLVSHPGLDLDQVDNDGSTALTTAASLGYPSVKILLQAGADPNVRQNESAARGTALMRAIDFDHDDVVQELLDGKADWTVKDDMDRGVLHSAAINGSTKCLRLLLQQLPGLDVNAQDVFGNTPLHDAAGHSSSAALQILMEYNARPDIQNNQGKLPLDEARESGFKVNARILHEKFTQDFGIPKRIMSGLMPEELTLVTAAAMGREKIVEAILLNAHDTNFIDLEEQDKWWRRTALQAAVDNDSVSIVRRLIAAGANLNHRDKFGRTALHLAALKGHTTIAYYLLLEDVAVNTRDQRGKSPLSDAYEFESWRIAIMLIEYEAELNTTDYDLEVLLMAASEIGSTKACERLVEAGADFQLKDGIGRSPYEIAKQAGHVETAKYLDRLGKSMSQTSVKLLSPAASETTSAPDEKVLSAEEVKNPKIVADSDGQSYPEITSSMQGQSVKGEKNIVTVNLKNTTLGILLAAITLAIGMGLGLYLGT